MNQDPSLKLRIAEMVAIPFEATLGLVIAIVSTQFFPRQALREPCYVRFDFFVCAAVILSLGLPSAHWLLRGWSRTQRLAGFVIAVATFAFLYFGLHWNDALRSSWEEAW